MGIGEHSALPEVLAQMRSDRSATVVFNGGTHELHGRDGTDTRAQALHYITGLAAQVVGGPVQVALTDPDGTGWRLVVGPDGDVIDEVPMTGEPTMVSSDPAQRSPQAPPDDVTQHNTAPTATSPVRPDPTDRAGYADPAAFAPPPARAAGPAAPEVGPGAPVGQPPPPARPGGPHGASAASPSGPAAPANTSEFAPGSVTQAFRGSAPQQPAHSAPHVQQPPAHQPYAPPSAPQPGSPYGNGYPVDGAPAPAEQQPSQPVPPRPVQPGAASGPGQAPMPGAPGDPGAALGTPGATPPPAGPGMPPPPADPGVLPPSGDPGMAAPPSGQGMLSPSGDPGMAPPPGLAGQDQPALRRRDLRESFLRTEQAESPATQGMRGALNRIGIRTSPNAAERAERADVNAVSQHWPGVRTIAVVNGKGGANKTPTTALLAAIFARHSGSATLAWDNNETRGTLGWRTEQGKHEATVQDLLPQGDSLLDPSAKAGDISHFVHHQAADKYDVLRSNPNVLSAEQRIDGDDVDLVHDVAGRYYRLIFIDSGNDESADHWLRMIDKADQLVVATIAKPEHAEAGALLLEALAQRDEHSAELAHGAVVVVSQAREKDANPSAQQIADGFTGWVREVVTIPYDGAMVESVLRFDSLGAGTKRAWLRAGAAIAGGL